MLNQLIAPSLTHSFTPSLTHSLSVYSFIPSPLFMDPLVFGTSVKPENQKMEEELFCLSYKQSETSPLFQLCRYCFVFVILKETVPTCLSGVWRWVCLFVCVKTAALCPSSRHRIPCSVLWSQALLHTYNTAFTPSFVTYFRLLGHV